jgi:hypothetical protein
VIVAVSARIGRAHPLPSNWTVSPNFHERAASPIEQPFAAPYTFPTLDLQEPPRNREKPYILTP